MIEGLVAWAATYLVMEFGYCAGDFTLSAATLKEGGAGMMASAFLEVTLREERERCVRLGWRKM